MESKYLFAIAILLILAAGLVQFNGFTGFFTANEQKQESIKIGFLADLSGDSAKYGEMVKKGFDLAVEEINAKGGVDGRKLAPIYEDTRSSASIGVSGAKKLIEVDGVSVILGLTSSQIALSVAPVAEKSKTIMFTPIASAPSLKYAGDYVFRNTVTAEPHGKKIAEFAFYNLSAKTAASLYINSDNGIAYNEVFTKNFIQLGGKILVSESFEKGAKDFKTSLLKIKEKNPNMIYFGGNGFEIAVKQARELQLDSIFIASPGAENKELLQLAGKAAEGLYYSYSAFDPDGTEPHVVSYQKSFLAKYGEKSEAYEANSYDMVVLVAKAMKECGDKNTDCIRDYLYSVKNYSGVGGLTTFDSFGEVTKPLVIKTVKDGKFVKYSS